MNSLHKQIDKMATFFLRNIIKQKESQMLPNEILQNNIQIISDSNVSMDYKCDNEILQQIELGCESLSEHLDSNCESESECAGNKPCKSRKRLEPVIPKFSLCEQQILECWGKMMCDGILEKIVKHTNEEIRRKLLINEGEPNTCEISLNEFKAYIGLLYIAGLERVTYKKPKELWSKQFGPTIFRATMNLQRFSFIGSCLRFEGRNMSEEPKVDKFAPIREVWEHFNRNCVKNYPPTEVCEIVDYRMEFKSRSPFRITNTRNQSVFGVKLGLMNDTRTNYLVSVIPYIPSERSKHYETEDDYYIRTLWTSQHNTRKNHKKHAVNKFAPMCEKYSTVRITNRWFEQMFYYILDYAALNATILYHMNNENPQVNRETFLRKLSIGLLKMFLPVPYETANRLSPHVKQQMKQIMDGCPPQDEIKGLTCYNIIHLKRSTIQRCFICAESVCEMHQRGFCPKCCDLL